MKRYISLIAICMAAILLFTSQPGFYSMSQRVSRTASNTITNAKTINLSATNEESTTNTAPTNEEEKPTAILPDDNSPVIEVPSQSQGNRGETIVPVKINNVIRDSLPNSVAKNIYTFTLDQRGMIVYAINHKNSDVKKCNWNVRLLEEYSPDGMGKTTAFREIEHLTYAEIGMGASSQSIGVAPGNYRIVVECYSGYIADKYDLAIGFSPEENFEIEPNDTMSRYTEMPLGKSFYGSASNHSDGSNDIDFFMFRVTDKGYSVLYFDHERDPKGQNNVVSWKISIINAEGYEYFCTTSGMDKASINSGIMGLEPGYYFVKIESRVHSVVTYTVNVSFTADTAVETEPNDTMPQATPLMPKAERVGSLTKRDGVADRDYYTFTMEQNGFVFLNFLHSALQSDDEGYRISILAENGSTIYSDTSLWSTSVMTTPKIGIPQGKYYILIDSDNLYHTDTSYRLIFDCEYNNSWETEQNNTTDTADAINLNSKINGTLVEIGTDYDADYFTFNIENETRLKVTFSHTFINEADKEGWIVTLRDENGNAIKTGASDWDDGEMQFAQTLSPGKYYISVETGMYFNSVAYELKIEG